MIKIEKIEVFNLEGAIRGARNPMNSWHKSDSQWVTPSSGGEPEFIIGENDLKLMKSLTKAGSDHRKFMRQIFVSMDITAPLYWWKEYDTYKVGTVANSCSTMHKIHAKEFTLADFSHEELLDGEVSSKEELVYPSPDSGYTSLGVLSLVIQALNLYRELFIQTKDKKYWHQMIQLLPTSYNQMRTCTMNYENLLNMYHSRKGHKLPEWHQLRAVIETLPYFKEICLEE
jgi:hypothetical protein